VQSSSYLLEAASRSGHRPKACGSAAGLGLHARIL